MISIADNIGLFNSNLAEVMEYINIFTKNVKRGA